MRNLGSEISRFREGVIPKLKGFNLKVKLKLKLKLKYFEDVRKAYVFRRVVFQRVVFDRLLRVRDRRFWSGS